MRSDTPVFASARQAAARFFGVTDLRPGQPEALAAVAEGEDALVVLPTGTGKSLVYQAGALTRPGVAIVVSPLIALMRDQTEDLRERGYPGAAALHSGIAEHAQQETLAALAQNQLTLLYVTPERFANPEFLDAARRATVAFLAIDEAHCISEWGHDFRPAYLLLRDAAAALGRPPVVALTATATPWVRDAIIEQLGLRRPRVIVRGFDRPNLFLEVYPAADEREKAALLTRLIARGEAEYDAPLAGHLRAASAGGGIVYTNLTRNARALSQSLNRAGVHAAYYHGQLKTSQRNAVQDHFRDGSVRAIAATNAFGLGIDRADLRFVVHYEPPPSLEAYYQEAGRAGRDGELARCALILQSEDFGRVAFAGGSGALTAGELAIVAQAIAASPSGLPRAAIAEATGLTPTRVSRALLAFGATGALRERRGRVYPARLDGGCVERAIERETRRQAHDRSRIEMVRAYARSEGCRRQRLLQYFGEYDAPERCDRCDRCCPRRTAETNVVAIMPKSAEARHDDDRESVALFQPGDQVQHPHWGSGAVQHVTEDRITVHFESAGYRTLDRAEVQERDLLTLSRAS